jgi:hypothetical protein
MESHAQAATPDTKLQMLRHTVATLAYRASKALRGAPEEFANFRASEKSRTPVETLAHMGDLFDWALWLAQGKHEWRDSAPLAWDEECKRFFATLGAFEAYLNSDQQLHFSPEKLFQGPIADALTHTGQLTMLRRLAGAPIRAENYFKADIVAGRVGSEQTPPAREF